MFLSEWLSFDDLVAMRPVSKAMKNLFDRVMMLVTSHHRIWSHQTAPPILHLYAIAARVNYDGIWIPASISHAFHAHCNEVYILRDDRLEWINVTNILPAKMFFRNLLFLSLQNRIRHWNNNGNDLKSQIFLEKFYRRYVSLIGIESDFIEFRHSILNIQVRNSHCANFLALDNEKQVEHRERVDSVCSLLTHVYELVRTRTAKHYTNQLIILLKSKDFTNPNLMMECSVEERNNIVYAVKKFTSCKKPMLDIFWKKIAAKLDFFALFRSTGDVFLDIRKSHPSLSPTLEELKYFAKVVGDDYALFFVPNDPESPIYQHFIASEKEEARKHLKLSTE